MDARGSDSGSLRLSLDKALTAGQVANLRLHVCGETYGFADATYSSALHNYDWPTAGLDWSGLVGSTRVLHLTGQPNRPATGLPAVTGTARVGSTVTASTALIRDADGLTGPAYEYRWLRVDGGSETEISGATGRTYELTGDDAGKRVRVRVSFTDDALNEETLDSAAFPRTGTIAMPVPAMTDPSDLLSATLTVKEKSGNLGCFATGSGVLCSSSSVMTDNDFTVGTVDYFISELFLRTDGSVKIEFGESVRRDVTGSWTLTLGTTELDFSDAARNDGIYTWTGTGLSWTADDTVAVKVKERGTGDVTPPELDTSINIPVVVSQGDLVQFALSVTHDMSGPCTR